MISVGLREWILGQHPVVSRLSGSGPEPVFVDEAEPGTREYILISGGTVDPGATLDEDDAAHNGLVSEDIDLDVKCETAGKARLVGKLLLDSLFGNAGNYTGTMGDRYVDGIWLDSMSPSYEPPMDGEAKGRHVATITLTVHHRGNQ